MLIAVDYEEMPADPDPHTFTIDDRRALVVLGVDMSYMKDAIEEIRKAVSDEGALHRRLAACEADVATLKQFRWWLVGVAVGGGAAVHLALDVIAKH